MKHIKYNKEEYILINSIYKKEIIYNPYNYDKDIHIVNYSFNNDVIEILDITDKTSVLMNYLIINENNK